MTAPCGPEQLLRDRRILVCVGTGGVGKTTVAAALALEGARLGRRALVLTIDPARRLADALGVARLGNMPAPISAEDLAGLGVPPGGSLSAVMLDMKRTFDDLVERFADGPPMRDRILENRIYRHVSDALAGSAEYAAMEKVYELCHDDAYDLIVVDTPPSQHALDFLDAPQRLVEFLDSRIVQLLLHPAFSAGRFGFRVFHRAALRGLRLLERVSGLSFLEDISEFLMAFEHMSAGFADRAVRVRSLLLGPEAGFLLVAGPSPEAAASGRLFLDRLDQNGVPLAGVAINRMRVWPKSSSPPAAFDNAALLEAPTRRLAEALAGRPGLESDGLRAARAALGAARRYAKAASLDLRSTQALRDRARCRGLFVRCIPEFMRDVHDLQGLNRIRQHLFEAQDCPEGEEEAVDDRLGTKPRQG